MDARWQKIRRSFYYANLSSALPWTHLQSALAGWRWRQLFRDVQAFALFIGNGRSGGSLVGSLLNAHRHVCIGHELNVLRYVARGYRRNQLFWLLMKQDEIFSRLGRRWTGYDYTVPNQWQGRFEQLKVIGDKKAGMTSTILGKRPELLATLEQRVGVPLRIIHLVRHPLDVITTMHRRQRWPLEKAADIFFDRAATNWRLMNERPETVLTLHIEDLIVDPRRHMVELCRFLELEPCDDYVRDAASILFASPRTSRSAVQWPAELVRTLAGRAAVFPFLARYQWSAAA